MKCDLACVDYFGADAPTRVVCGGWVCEGCKRFYHWPESAMAHYTAQLQLIEANTSKESDEG